MSVLSFIFEFHKFLKLISNRQADFNFLVYMNKSLDSHFSYFISKVVAILKKILILNLFSRLQLEF